MKPLSIEHSATPRFLMIGMLAFVGVVGACSLAQEVPVNGPVFPGGAAPVAAAAAPPLLRVDDKNLAILPALLQRNPGAVALRLPLAALNGAPASRDALINWVRGGGLVYLYTDAAQLFGYVTVAARPGSNRQGGQSFGRARAALPFGANPLLNDLGPRAQAAATARPGQDLSRLPGVNVVYYEMQPGDHLVVSHPSATPLLEVTDLSTNAGPTSYAAAIAAYGRGWTVFTPDYIDQRRADGAIFVRNLMALMPGARSRGQWVGVTVRNLEKITQGAGDMAQLLNELSGELSSPALPPLGTVGPAQPTAAGIAPAAEVKILVERNEAVRMGELLGGEDQGVRAAVIQLLRARAEWQRGNPETAATWIETVAKTYPDSAEVALLRGNVTAAAAQDVTLASPLRGQILANAVTRWDEAAAAPALVRVLMPASPVNTDTGSARAATDSSLSVGGMPVSALRDWSARARRTAAMFAAEPPLVQQVGTGAAAITLRYYEQDSSLRIMVPAIAALADARSFGWRADMEEVVLFPTPEYYVAYRRAAGLLTQYVPLPAGGLGDISGARILTVAVPSFPRLLRDATGRVRFVPGEASGSSILARLHAYVLVNALNEGGLRSPRWLELGLEALLNAAISGTAEIAPARDTLYQVAQAGGLMTPAQFQAQRAAGNANPGLAEAQAVAMVTYFYRVYGAGAVVETLQRTGAGQSVDDALVATTELTQLEFFGAWRDAEFGAQAFPNQG